MLDVAIIGGGIVGAACAYELSRYRLSVAVLERENDVACGTTKANSAILHAGYDPPPGTLMARLNVEGVRLAEELCRKLDVPYRQCGSLVAAFSGEDAGLLRTLYSRGVENGVPGLSLLDAAQVRNLEPNLSPEVVGALYAPTAAIVNPWEYALALAETAVRNGVSLHLNAGVTAIRRCEGGFELDTAAGRFWARYVLNAAGLYSDEVHNMAAAPAFRIHPDRGEYYLLDKSEGERVSHVVFQCPTRAGKGTLVAPTVHGNLIVGPNNEPPRERDDTATTAGGLEEVMRLARKSVPSINFRESIRNFAGVRAAADGADDFIIAEAADTPGLIDIAGIKSPGLSAAPAIARMAAELLEGCGLRLVKKDFFIDTRRRVRFKELTCEEKARLTEENPAYGRVICRCETITEGEILDALRGPIPPCSVDGVKRRCNAGMGRCQGGFCEPRVFELLARERGLPPEEILQDRAGSYIITGKTKMGGAGLV